MPANRVISSFIIPLKQRFRRLVGKARRRCQSLAQPTGREDNPLSFWPIRSNITASLPSPSVNQGSSIMSWSSVVCGLALPAVAVAALLAADAEPASKERKLEKVRVYVGTYTGKSSKGIYRLDLDLTT